VTTFTVGVFQDVDWARRGVAALVEDGFDAASLTLIAKDTPEAATLIIHHLGAEPNRLELKALGASVGSGPLIAALEGDDSGLRSRGLAAVIGRAGFQAHDGFIFETLVGRGGVLIGVSSEPRAADALAKLHAYGAGNAGIGAWMRRV
jgi:hypothetical protein